MCFYKWWRRRNRTGNESNLSDQITDGNFLTDHNTDKSLLEGNWELQSLDDPIARNEPLDYAEPFKTLGLMARSGRCVLTVKRNFSDAKDEFWIIRVTTPASGIVETRFKLGEKMDELTTYRVRATSVLCKPNYHKIVVHSKLKNGCYAQVTREVHPSNPNILISTFIIENNRAVAIYKRIMDDSDENMS